MRLTGDQLLAMLSALANPHRLRIVAALTRDGRNYVSQLAREVGISRPLLHLHLQKLEEAGLVTSKLELSSDGCNFRLIVESTLRRLEGITRPRSAHLRLLTSGERFTVALGRDDSALLAWRLLAVLAGALSPGEVVELALRGSGDAIELEAELPISLAGEEDIFATAPRGEVPSVTAGMFGTGFTLRLARAEEHPGPAVALEDLGIGADVGRGDENELFNLIQNPAGVVLLEGRADDVLHRRAPLHSRQVDRFEGAHGLL